MENQQFANTSQNTNVDAYCERKEEKPQIFCEGKPKVAFVGICLRFKQYLAYLAIITSV